MEPSERLTPSALAVLCATVVVAVTTASMVNVALPDIQEEFDVGADTLAWVVTAYILTFATGTIIYGRIADMAGVKPLYVFGLVLYAISSFAIAAVPWYSGLIILRAVQGFGGTAVPALALATIVRTTRPDRRGTAMGIIILAVGFGFGIGPLVGGVLTEIASWRLPFLVLGGVALALLPFVVRVVPSPPGHGWVRFDVVGALAAFAGISGVIIAINRLPGDPSGTLGWVGLAIAAPAALVFAWQEWRFPAPFVHRAILANHRFLLLATVALTTQGSHFALIFLIPILLADYHGFSVIEIGLAVLPGAASIGLFGALGGRLGESVGAAPMIILAGCVTLTAAVAFHVAGVSWPAWQIALLYVLFAGGYGVLTANINVGATSQLPDELAGLGTGVYNLFFFLGGALAVALAGAIVRARRGADALNPLHEGAAAEYSDAVLVIIALSALGLALSVATLGRAALGRGVSIEQRAASVEPGAHPGPEPGGARLRPEGSDDD